MNVQIAMSKTASRHLELTGRWSLGFPWSFGIGNWAFASGVRFGTRGRLAHPHLDAIVQFAQPAGGDDLAGFESGEDLLPSVLHAADFNSAGAGDAALDDKHFGD